jgi:hypothetical protein
MTLILSGTDSSVSAPAVQGGTGGTTTGIYYPATNQLALATNGTQALLVDSSQNVGIGAASPSSYNLNAYKLVIGSNSAVTGMTLASGTSAAGNIFFARGTTGADAYDGYVQYVQSGQYMAFGTGGGTERMRIDSSGNLLVGETTQTGSGKAEILQSTNNQGLAVVATNATYTNDAFIIYASRNTTNASYNAMAYYNSGAGAYKFKLTDGGNISLFGGQITFPATQSASSDANTLDDYEEGTFTPVLTFSVTTDVTYSNRTGVYTKVGRIVTINVSIGISSVGSSSGFCTIAGLPFTAGFLSNGNFGGDGTTFTGAYLFTIIEAGATQFYVANQGGGTGSLAGWQYTYPSLWSAGNKYISLTYITST